MPDKYEKKYIYEFCGLRNTMVRLQVIRATVRMPDWACAEVDLVPVDCNRAADCRREGIKCVVYDPAGQDPCPEAWRGEF